MEDWLAYALGYRYKVILGRRSTWGNVLYACKVSTAKSMAKWYSVPGNSSVIVDLVAR